MDSFYSLVCLLVLAVESVSQLETGTESTTTGEVIQYDTNIFCPYRKYECHREYCGDRRRMCSCDPDCVFYDDCCIDANISENCTINYKSSSTSGVPPPKLEYMACVRTTLSLQVPRKGGWMISKCPATFTDPEIKQLCENPPKDDVFLNTPVFVRTSKELYRNIYCINCHGDDSDDVIFWQLRMRCSERNADFTYGMYDSIDEDAQRIREVFRDAINTGCEKLLVIPEIYASEFNYRYCIDTDIDTCGSENCAGPMAPYWTVEQIGTEDDCQSCPLQNYTLWLYNKKVFLITSYRNIECAICNSAAVTDKPCELKDISGALQGIPSLANIFLLRDGYNVGTKLSQETVLSTCNRNEILDPYLQSCRSVFCPVDYKLIGSNCISTSNNTSSTYNLETKSGLVNMSLQVFLQGTPCDFPRDALQFDCLEIADQVMDALNKLLSQVTYFINKNKKLIEVTCASGENVEQITCARTNLRPNRCQTTISIQEEEISASSMRISETDVDQTELLLQDCHKILSTAVSPTSQTNGTGDNTDISGMNMLSSTQQDQMIGVESFFLRMNSIGCNQIENVRWEYKTNGKKASLSKNFEDCIKDEVLTREIRCAFATYDIMEYEMNGFNLTLISDNRTFTSAQYVMYSNRSVSVCSELLESAFLGLPGQIITGVGCSVSLTALFATIITYSLFRKLRNNAGKAILSLVTSLFFAQLLFISFGDKTRNRGLCIFATVTTHYSWLSVFFWMTVLAWDLSSTFGSRAKLQNVRESMKTFLKYCAFGVILPSVIIVVCFVLHLLQTDLLPFSYYNPYLCWLGVQENLYALSVPVAILLILNVVMFVDTVLGIRAANKNRKKVMAESKQPSSNGKKELLLYTKVLLTEVLCDVSPRKFTLYTYIDSNLKSILTLQWEPEQNYKCDQLLLTAVMGFTWLFGYIANIFSGTEIVWFVYLLLNSFQGVYIFLAFGCTDRVIQMWRAKLGLKKTKTSSSSSNTTRKSNSSSATKASAYTITR